MRRMTCMLVALVCLVAGCTRPEPVPAPPRQRVEYRDTHPMPAPPEPPPPPREEDWLVETIDGMRFADWFTMTPVALALDGAGAPVIAYWHINENALMLARRGEDGWSTQTVAKSEERPAFAVDLALDADDRAHIVWACEHVDEAEGFTCHGAEGAPMSVHYATRRGGRWRIEQLSAPGTDAFGPGIAVGPDGIPAVAFVEEERPAGEESDDGERPRRLVLRRRLGGEWSSDSTPWQFRSPLRCEVVVAENGTVNVLADLTWGRFEDGEWHITDLDRWPGYSPFLTAHLAPGGGVALFRVGGDPLRAADGIEGARLIGLPGLPEDSYYTEALLAPDGTPCVLVQRFDESRDTASLYWQRLDDEDTTRARLGFDRNERGLPAVFGPDGRPHVAFVDELPFDRNAPDRCTIHVRYATPRDAQASPDGGA